MVGLDMAVHSIRCEVRPRQDDGPVRDAVAAWLEDLAEHLVARGCTYIGHIKGMAAAPGEEPLFFSLTRLEGQPEFKGGGFTATGPFELSVSAILAGMSEEEIARTVRETLDTHWQIMPGEAIA